MDALYYYKLDEKTGEIKKQAVDNYEKGTFANNKPFYRYRFNGNMYYCYANDIDKVKAWRIYSFVNDDNRARGLFLEELQKKYKALEREARRFDEAIKMLIK